MILAVNKFPFPSGLLREFRFNLKRADLIINTGLSPELKAALSSEFVLKNLTGINFNKEGELTRLKNINCVAFAGIAHPENFKKSLNQHGLIIKDFIPYKDHHLFDKTDIHFLADRCNEHNCKHLLCTEKDLIKLGEIEGLKDILDAYSFTLYAPQLNVVISDENLFSKKLNHVLDSF